MWLLVLAGGQLTATEYDVDETTMSECAFDKEQVEFNAKRQGDVMLYSITCYPADDQQ